MSGESEITSAIEVVHLLRQLIRTRELLNAAFNQGRDSITTLLLEADRDRDRVIFDGSRNAAINQGIVSASRVVFSGSLYGAKIQFHVTGTKEVLYRGSPAVQASFPSSLRHTQHRQSFRVRTGAASFVVPVPGRGNVTFQSSEMSVGGTQLLLDYASDVFHIGQIVDCQVKLAGGDAIRCKIEVRNFKRLPAGKLGMGCRFLGLAPADESRIARFVSQQEREKISRSSFFGL